MPTRPGSRRALVRLAATLSLTVLAVAGALPATADSPSPQPTTQPTTQPPSTTTATPPPGEQAAEPSVSASEPGAGATSATPDASDPSAGTPTPGTPTPGTPTPGEPTAVRRGLDAAPERTLSLSVAAAGSPVPGRFFQDIGSYAFSGLASGLPDGTALEIYRHTPETGWQRFAGAGVVRSGAYAVSVPVTALGTFTFASTTGGAPGSGDEVASNQVKVLVADSAIVLDAPAATIDSLKNPTLRGSVVPARAGVKVHLDVVRSGRFRFVASTTTDSAGRFAKSLSYGAGNLATYTVRATYQAANRDRWESSSSRKFARIGVINAVVTATTDAEIEKTYHRGCPVGKSKLRTVTMNFYGRDKKMHRGVLIVRSDLTAEVIRGFNSAMTHRFPVQKMRNPNVYDGNDPRQMKANNSSGFNCRTVVGNPYRQSPHSYGIAIDVNPVQNPYRDVNGRWWPSNGTSYIDRTPRRFGMLTRDSYLTRSLRSDDYFWGGLLVTGAGLPALRVPGMRSGVRAGACLLGAGLALTVALSGCSPGAQPPEPPGPSPAPGSPAPASPAPGSPAPASGTAAPAEPTTTNTLPPPPPPTAPAPSTAGRLDQRSLPVPAGWRTVALKGGEEEGFEGNGTWVHARDPRYAALDVIAVGCADVTRDDYRDPTAALEGNYENRSGAPGVGLVLQFGAEADATSYFALYGRQVQACTTVDRPVRTRIVTTDGGLIDRRTYPDSEWTEIGKQVGDRVTLVILSDAGHRISPQAARKVLAQIT